MQDFLNKLPLHLLLTWASVAEIIPFGSRARVGVGKVPAGNSVEILRTIGKPVDDINFEEVDNPNPHPRSGLTRADMLHRMGIGPTTSFFITYTSPKTGRKIRLDGPFGSHQEAISAMAEMKKADPRAAEAGLDIESG